MIRILYFASLREQLGCDEEQIQLPSDASVTNILTLLKERGDPWTSALAEPRRILVAVNQEMAKAETKLADGDEVAFFPPVTGG